MAFSSSATIREARHYDVFLSFRGEDTRKGFTSHLYEALCKSHIMTFIDNNLERGDDIYPSLLTAIEESMISVIIFSEDYADSKSCLKELAKILQRRELNGQIVIPVFYGVDPSHIRNQTEKVGIAFDKLKERLQEGQMDLNEVRSHLEKAANMSGWVSQDFSSERKLIEAIVGDVLNKLNAVTKILPTSFVGISSHVERVETLLCLDSPKFRIVGLWGMGGIGKTTIARAVFDRIYNRFDGCHFVENISKESKSRCVDGLCEKIVLKLFEEERQKMGNRTLRPDFIRMQLQRKKVLFVLDDLDDALLAEKLLIIESHLFCGGSRVLVTSRDKQVLKNIVDNENQIYEVKGLSKEDGLRLFSLRAFKQNHPTSDLLELSQRVLSYAGGNPLALVNLGCALRGKSKNEWVSALDGLGDEPFPNIQKGGEGGGEGDKEKKGGDAPAEEKKEGAAAAAAGGGEVEAKGDVAPPSEQTAFVELKKNDEPFPNIQKGGEGGGEGDKEKKGGDAPAEEKKEGAAAAAAAGGGEVEAKGDVAPPSEETAFVELKKNEYLFYPQRPAMDLYAYPPQMFSDENPNACSVM